MTKKSSEMAPSKLQDNTVLEEKKPSDAPKKASSEIDEIFAGKKRKKSELGKSGKSEGDVTKRPDKTKKNKKNMKKKTKGSNDDEFVEPSSRPRKRTEDGLAIYTEEELGINKADAGAGGTPDCPFDCSCCF